MPRIVRGALLQASWTGDKESMIQKHEAAAHEASAQEASAHEAAAHDASAQDAALHEAAAQEASAHEAAAHDALAVTVAAQLAESNVSPGPPDELRNLFKARLGFGGVFLSSAAFPAFN